MQRLILFRHGAAQARALSERDVDRALSPAGRAAAAATAAALHAAGVTPDLVLVSPALRTRQTWEAARAVWPEAVVREVPELYNAAAETLLGAAQLAGASCVMIVGHNPGVADLAGALVDDPRVRAGFPPASAAVLDAGGGGWSLAFWRAGDAR